MLFLLSIYGNMVYKEYILPNKVNIDHDIMLSPKDFVLSKKIGIHLENIDGRWFVKAGKWNERFCMREDQCYEIEIEKLKLTIITKNIQEKINAYDKFILSDPIKIGRSEENEIIFNHYNLVSRTHVVIEKLNGEWTINALGINGAYVNNVFLRGRICLKFGDIINIVGLHFIFLERYIAIETSRIPVILKKCLKNKKQPLFLQQDKDSFCGKKEKSQEGIRLYHRSPRNMLPMVNKTIVIDSPPAKKEEEESSLLLAIGPAITMGLPMVGGSLFMIYAMTLEHSKMGLYMYSSLIMAGISTLLAIFWVIMNRRIKSKKEKEEEKRKKASYEKYLEIKSEEIKNCYDINKRIMLQRYISAKQCSTYGFENDSLWNRTWFHEDFLGIRIGIGDIPFSTKIVLPEDHFELSENHMKKHMREVASHYEYLLQVPIILDLARDSQIGVVSCKEKDRMEAANVIIAQIAANNCYTEVKMVFLYDKKELLEENCWDYVRWLPHVWDKGKRHRYIAANEEDIRDILYDMTKIFKKRAEDFNELELSKRQVHYIFFVTIPHLLESEAVMPYLNRGDLGVSVVWIVEDKTELPYSCELVINKNNSFQGIYRTNGKVQKNEDIVFDSIEIQDLDHFSRRLSNVQVNETEENIRIPEVISFFEMYGISNAEELHIIEHWKKRHTYENLKVLVGEREGGRPFYLDVHEKYHGPHGLIAGTTGSGKSEVLQTFILSLAVNFSPRDVNFFLIDYKGGGMSSLFEGLPHISGQISNLSGGYITRAMSSIKSENRRRQELLRKYNINNINAYTKISEKDEEMESMPHLFIIIDEFAELKKEEPEFMQELISVAQVGRSLGVHLILATQKPGGTVDEKIWSNARFHLCLRVQDRQDSMDMLHKEDASKIIQTGRAYFQVGNDEIYQLFQSGWSGAEALRNKRTGEEQKVELVRTNGEIEHHNFSTKKELKEVEHKSQLEVVRDYIIKIARENNYKTGRNLWMEPLPATVYLEDIKYNKKKMCVGIIDDPENQTQFPLFISVFPPKHTAVYGSVMCGKSTFVQTFLYNVQTFYSPQYIHLYGLDFSSGGIGPYGDMPHTAGILGRGKEDQIRRMLQSLEKIMLEREKLFGDGNYEQYVKAYGVKEPIIFLVIDGFGKFNEYTNQKYEELIIKISKEGENLGIMLLITGLCQSISEIPLRVGENIKTIICLEMKDQFAYGDALRMLHVPIIPRKNVRGRGIVLHGDRLLEFQTAIVSRAENDYQRIEKLKQVSKKTREKWKDLTVIKNWDISEKYSVYKERIRGFFGDMKIPFGYNDDTADVYFLDKQSIYCFGIMGKEGSGKRNCLKLLMDNVGENDGRIKEKQYLVCTKDHGLKDFKSNGIHLVQGEEAVVCLFEKLTPIFEERSQKRQQKEGFNTEYYIYIDDLYRFIKMAYESKNNISGFLENVWEKGANCGVYFYGILDSKDQNSALGYEAISIFFKNKQGVHLGGNVFENNILCFDTIPYEEQMKSYPSGTGVISHRFERKQCERIIFPRVEHEDLY